jgi:hypothetical protein
VVIRACPVGNQIRFPGTMRNAYMPGAGSFPDPTTQGVRLGLEVGFEAFEDGKVSVNEVWGR